MELVKLNSTITSIINARIADELTARYFYEAAANWCREKGFAGGEKYFSSEAMAENEHYTKLIEYLSDWNVTPTYPTIKPVESFSDYVSLFTRAYDMEFALYESYESDARKAFQNDISAFTFLQGYVKIQQDSVFEYSTLLNKLEQLNTSNKLDLMFFDTELLNN